MKGPSALVRPGAVGPVMGFDLRNGQIRKMNWRIRQRSGVSGGPCLSDRSKYLETIVRYALWRNVLVE